MTLDATEAIQSEILSLQLLVALGSSRGRKSRLCGDCLHKVVLADSC